MANERVSDERLAELLASYNWNLAERSGMSVEDDEIEEIVSALTELQALRSPHQGEVEVKPLEWVGDGAMTPFGKYRVGTTEDGYELTFEHEELVHIGYNAVDPFQSARNELIGRAQADYRSRILSALQPSVPKAGEE